MDFGGFPETSRALGAGPKYIKNNILHRPLLSGTSWDYIAAAVIATADKHEKRTTWFGLRGFGPTCCGLHGVEAGTVQTAPFRTETA